jgi:predicted transcriptional regulator
MNFKKETKIFKALGNENRLKIIKLLYPNNKLSVIEITDEINLSEKSTSKHLIQMANLNILENQGKEGRVYYYIDPKIDPKIKEIIENFLF